MENKYKWSEVAWKQAEPVYRSILDLPFVRELAAGTLERSVFERYIAQDSLYIGQYSKVLAHIASRLSSTCMTETFLRFAQDGVAVEKALHSMYLDKRPDEMSPACRFYTSVLSAQAEEAVEVEAAAILPCFWVYLKVGKEIARQSDETNPYKDWISTYSDMTFEKSTEEAISICNSLAEKASESVRDKMTKIFVECTRLEWLFWHGAYADLKWEI
ncbi:MAG: thiaminase II [Bacteroides sp.]|nr:thiaminase II [Bacteroides sp.]